MYTTTYRAAFAAKNLQRKVQNIRESYFEEMKITFDSQLYWQSYKLLHVTLSLLGQSSVTTNLEKALHKKIKSQIIQE